MSYPDMLRRWRIRFQDPLFRVRTVTDTKERFFRRKLDDDLRRIPDLVPKTDRTKKESRQP